MFNVTKAEKRDHKSKNSDFDTFLSPNWRDISDRNEGHFNLQLVVSFLSYKD